MTEIHAETNWEKLCPSPAPEIGTGIAGVAFLVFILVFAAFRRR